MNISENFTLKEFLQSETANKNGFLEQYSPPETVIHNVTLLSQKVAERIRAKFGPFTPTCAYRCDRTNAKVGGAKYSKHKTGQAFDETFILNGKNISDKVFYWLLKSDVEWTKIIWEYGDNDNPNWLHIEYVEGAKKEVYYIFKKGVYVPYLGSVLEKYHKSSGKY